MISIHYFHCSAVVKPDIKGRSTPSSHMHERKQVSGKSSSIWLSRWSQRLELVASHSKSLQSASFSFKPTSPPHCSLTHFLSQENCFLSCPQCCPTGEEKRKPNRQNICPQTIPPSAEGNRERDNEYVSRQSTQQQLLVWKAMSHVRDCKTRAVPEGLAFEKSLDWGEGLELDRRDGGRHQLVRNSLMKQALPLFPLETRKLQK